MKKTALQKKWDKLVKSWEPAPRKIREMSDGDVVELIRADEKIGRCSCSHFDECYSDAELVEYIREYHNRKNEKFIIRVMRREAKEWLAENMPTLEDRRGVYW